VSGRSRLQKADTAAGVNQLLAARERRQADLLVITVGTLLALATLHLVQPSFQSIQNRSSLLRAVILSLTFGVLAWVLRAATPAAAVLGSLICLLLSTSVPRYGDSPAHSGLIPLVLLFALTFAATRLGRAQKKILGLAEPAHGRNAAQVIANLGVAGMIAAIATWPALTLLTSASTSGRPALWPTLLVAALAEATADTLSSEIGQAFGGTPWLITRMRRVAPGTDGGVSLVGTMAGLAGAALISLAGMAALRLHPAGAIIAFVGGASGLLFDSFLGATVERRGWLGNDLVNFASTLFSVLVALIFSLLF
jgi:uncharacterized protein (TIGR00297 family)